MTKVLLILLVAIVSFGAFGWLTALFAFKSADHSQYDLPEHTPKGTRTSESAEHNAMAELIATGMAEAPSGNRKEALLLMRKQLDERGEAAEIKAQVFPVDAGGVRAEWVIAPDARTNRRLLYIHGGAYMSGSPKSHRPITSRMSKLSGAAVLAIDYRLMPENPRMAGIDDCRAAYAWILKNGPDGPSSISTLIVAGDSAGGNLALSTIVWARDNGLRAADAVVVMSPQTDATYGSPSLEENIETDIMQGSSFGPIIKAPRTISLWVSFLMNRINPRNPIVSPLLGDLSRLPPTLLQVSEAEMFLDDAIRYANKAKAQGSPADLQSWPFMMHVWQAFDVPEADEAFTEIERFLSTHTTKKEEGVEGEI